METTRRQPRQPGYLPWKPGSLVCAAIPSVRFLTMFVKAWDKAPVEQDVDWSCGNCSSNTISDGDPHKEQDPAHAFAKVVAFEASFRHPGKRENSSTMRLISSTCLTIVSVHWSNISRSCFDQAPICCVSAVRRKAGSASAGFDFMGDTAGDIGPGRCPLGGHKIRDVVERHDVAFVGTFAWLTGDAHVKRRSRPPGKAKFVPGPGGLGRTAPPPAGFLFRQYGCDRLTSDPLGGVAALREQFFSGWIERG